MGIRTSISNIADALSNTVVTLLGGVEEYSHAFKNTGSATRVYSDTLVAKATLEGKQELAALQKELDALSKS